MSVEKWGGLYPDWKRGVSGTGSRNGGRVYGEGRVELDRFTMSEKL